MLNKSNLMLRPKRHFMFLWTKSQSNGLNTGHISTTREYIIRRAQHILSFSMFCSELWTQNTYTVTMNRRRKKRANRRIILIFLISLCFVLLFFSWISTHCPWSSVLIARVCMCSFFEISCDASNTVAESRTQTSFVMAIHF